MSADGTPQQRALPLDLCSQSPSPKETKGMAKARAVAEAKFARREKAEALHAEKLARTELKAQAKRKAQAELEAQAELKAWAKLKAQAELKEQTELKAQAKLKVLAELKAQAKLRAQTELESWAELRAQVTPGRETRGMAKARKKVEARIAARQQVQETQMKLCKKCNQLLAVEMFSPNGGHVDGYHSRCRQCVQTMLSNKNLRAQIYYQSNLEAISARHQKYRHENPEVGLAIKHLQRTRLKGNGGSFTARQIRDMRVAQNHKCVYCQRTTKLTIDHIFPVSKGGSSDIANICLACRKCNSSKGAKLLEEWVNRWYERDQ